MMKRKCILFDIDGTLTEPRQKITLEMQDMLLQLQDNYLVGVVGGSNEEKIREQIGQDLLDKFDYVFFENGLVAYKRGVSISTESIQEFLGDEKLSYFIDSTLIALSRVKIPKKRGTFVELRKGLINISPIGRDCSQEEREEFEKYDSIHKVRHELIAQLQHHGKPLGLKFSIGGQISFDVFPQGWDKTYCLKFLLSDEIGEIHFFGDKTHPGGNDHEIYVHPRTVGHRVRSYLDTMSILRESFLR